LVGGLKPDVYVKGGNYQVEDLPEAKVVAGYGGQVYLTSVTSARSTTNLIAAVLAHYGRDGE
jgi:bifunctional ADP-heptose synthase (sugar kinase/adenylyltransferase)